MNGFRISYYISNQGRESKKNLCAEQAQNLLTPEPIISKSYRRTLSDRFMKPRALINFYNVQQANN